VAALARVGEVEGSRLTAGLDDAFALVAGRFFRREVRVRARACLSGMLSGLERKTSWMPVSGTGRRAPLVFSDIRRRYRSQPKRISRKFG
jgi:hypothetical protein